jgi:hypothetical protein
MEWTLISLRYPIFQILCNMLGKRAIPVKVNSSSTFVILDAFFCSTLVYIFGTTTDFTILQ